MQHPPAIDSHLPTLQRSRYTLRTVDVAGEESGAKAVVAGIGLSNGL